MNPLKWNFNQKCAAFGVVTGMILCQPVAWPIILGAMNAPHNFDVLQLKSEEHSKALAEMKKNIDQIPQMQQQLNNMDAELHLLCDRAVKADEPEQSPVASNGTIN